MNTGSQVMSPWGHRREATNGEEKRGTQRTATWVNGLSDLDAELNFPWAIRPTRNPMASLKSSFKM
jgi:hypothetical protein